MNRLERIKERIRKANKGPWTTNKTGLKSKLPDYIPPNVSFLAFDDDAEFVAHSRTDIEDLVKVVDTAIEVVEWRRDTRRGSLPLRADNFQKLVEVLQPLLEEEK